MGCANCANNVPSAGLVVINDDAKMPSIDKVHFPSSYTNSSRQRTEPLKYISTIEKYKMNIKTNNEHFYLYINEKIKINLYKGISAFDDFINFLKKFAERKKKLMPLVMKEELKIPFPVN